MTVLNKSTYRWNIVRAFGVGATVDSRTNLLFSGGYNDVCVDPISQSVYVGGVRSKNIAGTDQNAWVIDHSFDGGDTWRTEEYFFSGTLRGIFAFSNGLVLACGSSGSNESATRNWSIRQSHISSSIWSTADLSGSFDRGIASECWSITQGISGALYAVGNSGSFSVVRKSHITQSNSWTDVFNSASSWGFGIAVRANDNIAGGEEIIFVGDQRQSGAQTRWCAMSSTDAGASWQVSDIYSGTTAGTDQASAQNIIVDPVSKNIYAGGSSRFGVGIPTIRSSSFANNNAGATWGLMSTNAGQGTSVSTGTHRANKMCIEDLFLYVPYGTDEGAAIGSFPVPANFIRVSSSGVPSTSFTQILNIHSYSFEPNVIPEFRHGWCAGSAIDASKNIYCIVAFGRNNPSSVPQANYRPFTSKLIKGKLVANSQSFGPTIISPSLAFVSFEATASISHTTSYKLMNVAEFPHSSGIFQMRNLVLGTTDSGRVGRDEDSIVKVDHVGSIVRVFWPEQTEQEAFIKGFGDFSAGQRAGKLLVDFQDGDPISVSGSDHLTLFCYLTKQASGTMENIEIKVHRKPLNDIPFAVEQALSYDTSGSYTVGTLTDLIFKKQIDYGDLSVREIGFPIDIPLVNLKQVMVSARQTVGQLEENKNFIIWGRLIKRDGTITEV